MQNSLSIWEIMSRLLLTVIVAGAIGFEREFKSRPAGMRTHILVGVGATVIALIQYDLAMSALDLARQFPESEGVIRSDPARLIAQVVSGVGFLGAGTIIVQRRSVTGLTTAASLWATAGLGLAIGMGYYLISVVASIIILLTLFVLQKVLVVPSVKKVEIKYIHKMETKEFINRYFEMNHINVRDVDFNVEIADDVKIYTNVYTIELPRALAYPDFIEDLSAYKNITKIRIVTV